MIRLIKFTVAMSTCGIAWGDLPGVQDGSITPIVPQRVALFDANFGRAGPWLEYPGGGLAGGCAYDLAYDAMDAGGNYGVNCGYWPPLQLGSGTYCNMYSADDMRVGPGAEGAFAKRVSWFWTWHPEIGGHDEEQCYVVIFTTETFATSCLMPPFTGTYDGVVYDFGVLASKEGYYFADVELCWSWLGHQLTTNGSGGFGILFLQDLPVDPANLATCAMPGLWGTKSPENNRPGNSPFHSGSIHWDDDLAPFGELTLDECFHYAGGGCPDPVSTAIAFYYDNSCAGFTCGDANCDGVFDGGDIDAFFLSLSDPWTWQPRYPNCSRICVADINGDDSVDGADIDAFFEGLIRGHCRP